MSPRTSLLALAGAVTLAIAAHPRAQTRAQSTRLADARILGSPILSLDLPANDATTSSIVPRVLDAGGVPYGFEGAALQVGVPPVDFATPVRETLTLTGLTLGAALDAIASANAHVRWKEEHGAILVRTMPGGQGLLDQKIARFVVVDASPRTILETLMTAIDPARAPGVGIVGMGRPAAGRANAATTRRGKNVTIALDHPTVLEVLEAASRENGALSWSVTYAQAPASARTARIVLSESGEITAAEPLDPSVPIAGIVVPSGDIVSMLSQYLRLAPVVLAVEQLPASGPSQMFVGLPPIYLGGVPPREAIARIVAYDSRYEWSEKGGIFHVRPKAGTPGRSNVLDQTMPSFVRTGQPTAAVVAALISNVTQQPRTSFSTVPTSANRAALDQIARKSIDVSFAGSVTVREVLDAICREAGGVSWVLRGNRSVFGLSHNLQLVTADGAAVSRSFSLRSGPMPTRPPAHPLPEAFSKISVGSVAVSISQPGNPFANLAAAGEVPIGVELLPRLGRQNDPRVIVGGGSGIQVGPGTFADAAYVLMENLPEYEFAASGNVVDVAPSRLLHDPAHFLNQRIGRFEVMGMPTRDVICLLRERMNPAAPPSAPCRGGAGGRGAAANRLGPAGAALDRPISLALDDPTPRDVLNAIIGKYGDLTWLVTYEGKSVTELAEPREGNAVIALGTFFGGSTIPERFMPYRGPTSSPEPAPAPPPSVPSLRRSPSSMAALNLPATSQTVELALQRLTTIVHASFGVESVTEFSTRPMVPSLTGDSYDLSGMSLTEALDAIAELGGATWTGERGIYRVRSKALAGVDDLPLDRKIAHFEQQLSDARAATAAVRELMININQPGSASVRIAPGASFSTSISVNSAPPPPVMGRPISVNLSNVTVREILDEIVRQYGDAAWCVTYISANGTYPEIQLRLASSNWSSSTVIPIR